MQIEDAVDGENDLFGNFRVFFVEEHRLFVQKINRFNFFFAEVA
jgi:hypothetical protein